MTKQHAPWLTIYPVDNFWCVGTYSFKTAIISFFLNILRLDLQGRPDIFLFLNILMLIKFKKLEKVKVAILGALGLFNDAVRSSNYLVSNDRLIMNI